MDGLLALDDAKGVTTDLRVKFRGAGVGHYILWGDDYTISKPAGDLKFTGPKLGYNISGIVFGKDMSCKGDVDLSEGANDYTVEFRGGSFPYPVFSKPLPFEKVRADVTCRKGIADYNVKAALLEGDFSMRGKFDDRKMPQSYDGDMRFNAVSYDKLARIYSPENDTEGDLTGHVEFTGVLGNWKALKGKGALVIVNSNLYAVPILGPLTPILGALLPRPIKGYNVAKKADATFTLANGFLTTDDFDASTSVFNITSKGQIDYLEDRIQFHAQVKFGKLLGLVLFPLSKILEYTGEGTAEDPKWRPRFFSAPSEKTPFRRPDQDSRIPPDAPSPPKVNTAPKPSSKPAPPASDGGFTPQTNPPVRIGK
jgi:hypothetical protein